MEFRISDTFIDSLSKLTGQEQKIAKMTAFDLQLNPSSPSLRYHKLERTKDPNFCSISVNLDLRLIVHRTENSLLLCYVDHHDKAYAWANRRKIENHPRTGAAQLVELREVSDVVVSDVVESGKWLVNSKNSDLTPKNYPLSTNSTTKNSPLSTKPTAKKLLFAHISDDDLLSYGIPLEWISDVKSANEDRLFDMVDHLPQEAAEALLEIATGGKPKPTIPTTAVNPFDHPDAQRRFRIMSNAEELQQALDYPWEKWTVFLHPSQRSLVAREYSGAARVSGSAGTGKTIVALHRAVFLARKYPNAQLLLTTFSPALANALQIKLDRLIGNDAKVISRIRVSSIQDIAWELYNPLGNLKIADPLKVRAKLVAIATQNPNRKFSESLLWDEWNDVVDAWQLDTWENYRDVTRLGRKTKLGSKQREILWEVFQEVRNWLRSQNLITWSGVFGTVTDSLNQTNTYPFQFAIIDECQDMGIAELRFLAAIGTQRPDSLFFTGDLGQRIFQQPFSWKSLGVDIRGRSQTLTINYRTSFQIRTAADRLLPSSIADVDGNQELRKDTISVFNGIAPEIKILDDDDAEGEYVAQWIANHLANGIQPDEIGVFVRDKPQIERAIAAVMEAGVKPVELSDRLSFAEGRIAVSTMHLAKGLEFRAVVVMACDDEVLPLQERVENISDESDLEEVYNTERHLLYVACTRARDYLLITGVDPASEFLDDLRSG
ncbi:MAG: 3'-5' exonuclease [Pseudanabaena sp.]